MQPAPLAPWKALWFIAVCFYGAQLNAIKHLASVELSSMFAHRAKELVIARTNSRIYARLNGKREEAIGPSRFRFSLFRK
jgi:hypothetical protein